jgi:hypothetical protein
VKEMAKRIEGTAEEVASGKQTIWGLALIIMRIQEIIARQVKRTESAIG